MFALSNLIMILRGCEREKCPEAIKEVNNIAKKESTFGSVQCSLLGLQFLLDFVLFFFYLFIFESGPRCLPLADLTLM